MSLDRIMLVIQGVIKNPTEDVTLTVLVASAAALLLLILNLVVLLAIAPKKKRVKKIIRRWVPDSSGATVPESVQLQVGGVDDVSLTTEKDDAEVSDHEPVKVASEPMGSRVKRRAHRAPARVIDAVVFGTLIIGALLAAYAIGGLDQVCTSFCHSGDAAVSAVHPNDHADAAACVDCHESGALAVLSNTSSRVRMAAVRLGLADRTGLPVPVDSAACANCHAVATGVIESTSVTIRMRHTEPLAAGWNCTDCHGKTGHLGEAGRVPISMNTCLGCHNGEQASTECETCHMADVASVARTDIEEGGHIVGSGKYQYTPVKVSRRDCEGCHRVETECDPCHQTRLPHPDRFVAGYHAKEAAFEKKEACWRCHDSRDCDACHAPFSTGHPDGWKQYHKRYPWDAGCSCHARQANQDVPICVFCHDNAPYQKVAPVDPL